MKPAKKQKTPNHPWRFEPGCIHSPKARDEFQKRNGRKTDERPVTALSPS
jgi:hypothetical protein